MTTFPEHHLQTGGNTRKLADYAALHDEMSKLTHPARPDVDWLYAENSACRCLNSMVLSCRLPPGMRLFARSVPGCMG